MLDKAIMSIKQKVFDMCKALYSKLKNKFEIDEIFVIIFLTVLLLCAYISSRTNINNLIFSNFTYFTIGGIFSLATISILATETKITSKTYLNYIRDWWPLVGGLFVYGALKNLHANNITIQLGIEPKDNIMLKVETIVFGKALPLYTESIIRSHLTCYMEFAYYILYYIFPITVLLYFQFNKNNRQYFYSLRRIILITLFGGYIFYLLVPVAGPLYTIGDQFTKRLYNDTANIKLAFDTLRYNWDCFPSLHTAIPWVITLASFNYSNLWLKILLITATLSITFSTIYLRYHYGIDVLAGILWALIVYLNFKRTIIMNISNTTSRIFSLNWRYQVKLLLLLFTLTGFAGLISEQIYEKLLETVVGVGAISASIVLSAFFLGLSVGAFLYSKIKWLKNDPLYTYVMLEIFVGAWSLGVFLFFHQIQNMSATIIHHTPDHYILLPLSKFIVSCTWILPPTLAMGATFPAVVGIVKQWRLLRPQILITKLYSYNVFGAVIATILGPYWLFPSFGLVESLNIITLIEVVVAFLAILTLKNKKTFKRNIVDGLENNTLVYTTPKQERIIFLISFISGFIFFSFEVIWVHLIGSILGNSIYSFSSMLTIVLISIFFAGLIVANQQKNKITIPVNFFANVLILIVTMLTVSFFAWDKVPQILPFLRPVVDWANFLIPPFISGQIVKFVFCFMLIGGPCIFMSMLYPLLFRIASLPKSTHDKFVAKVSCLNSIGCILGALITGFYLIPIAGSENTYISFNTIFAILSIFCIFHFFGTKETLVKFGLTPKIAISFLLIFLIGLQLSIRWDRLWLTAGTNVYFGFSDVLPGTRLLFWHEDTKGGFTTVVENTSTEPHLNATRTLLTNGKFQGNDNSEVPAQIGFALIPLLHQHHKNRALVIGLGTGQTAAVVHAAGIKNVDIAEISPGIVKAAKNFFDHTNDNILLKNNVKLIYEDGRNLLLRNKTLYDLITIEITNVWFAGATNLYSREFYELAYRNLNKDGIFQQWIQFHHIATDEVISTVATLRSVFPYVSVWYFGGQGILLASPSPLNINQSFNANVILKPELLDKFLDITDASVFSTELVNKYMILNSKKVDNLYSLHFIKKMLYNTDGNRYLEFSTPKHNLDFTATREKVIKELLQFSNEEL